MTANDLIRRLQDEVGKLSSGDIPLVCNLVECDVDVKLVEDDRGHYVNLEIQYHF